MGSILNNITKISSDSIHQDQDYTYSQFKQFTQRRWDENQTYLYKSQVNNPNTAAVYKMVKVRCDLKEVQNKSYFEKQNKQMLSCPLDQANQTFLRKIPTFYSLFSASMKNLSVNAVIHKKASFRYIQFIFFQFFYEVYDISVRDELIARFSFGERFLESQIWYLLYSVISAAVQFEHLHQKLENITINALVMNKHGQLKVRNQLTSLHSKPNHQNEGELTCYYSDEEMTIMREYFGKEIYFNKDIYHYFRINPHIAQTYAVAILFLELCTATKANHFYDLTHFTINYRLIDLVFKSIIKNYSILLQNMLKVMLGNHQDRPLLSQIYQILQPYSYQILRLRPFSFNVQSMRQSRNNSFSH